MRKFMLVFVLVLAVFAAGCMQGKAGGESSDAAAIKEKTTISAADGSKDVTVDDVDLPLIGDNDTVEIGQMI